MFAESNWADTFSATYHFVLFTALWVADLSVSVFLWVWAYGWVADLCVFVCVCVIEADRCWQLRRITFLLVKHHIDPVAPPQAEVSGAGAQQAEWGWHPAEGWGLRLNPQHYTDPQSTLDTHRHTPPPKKPTTTRATQYMGPIEDDTPCGSHTAGVHFRSGSNAFEEHCLNKLV